MARIDSFLRLVVEQNASDLHFHTGTKPIIRYQKDLVTIPFRSLSADETERFILEIMNDEQQLQLDRDRQVDFAYEVEGHGRFRVNVFQKLHGLGAVFRVIPGHVPSLDSIAMPPVLKRLAGMGSGLVLVTGPTGSGKTTTLAAIVNEINRTSDKHIITVEDPIEYVHEPDRSFITQRQVGLHAASFAGALRSALRESPDVLVVGELRDRESVHLALSAAETGVLVFGTLHTNSAAKAVDRLIDVGADDNQEQIRAVIAVLLRAVIAQTLCKRSTDDGLVAACEIMLQSYAISHMIRENKVHQIEGYLQSTEHAGSGMQSLDRNLLELVQSGIITGEEAVKVASRPETLQKTIERLPQN